MKTSVQIRVLCACGQEAVRESEAQFGEMLSESVEVYRCPSAHVTQVYYSLVSHPSSQRGKPYAAPSFPGRSQSW